MHIASSSTLYIKHLPSQLSASEREELLKLAGAERVNVLRDDSKMRFSAFATFRNHEEAKRALSLLHQKEILGKALSVEFARCVVSSMDSPRFQEPQEPQRPPKEKEVIRLGTEDFSRKLHHIAPGLDYLPSPLLRYKYPPPTQTTLQNISHALASVPKFYNQVLHLMNKMNLPAPFGPLTPAPPLAPIEEEVISEEESEYESGEENSARPLVESTKRPLKRSEPKRKKRKLKHHIPVTLPSTNVQTEPSEVFESQPIERVTKINVKKIDAISIVPATEEAVGAFGAFEGPKSSSEVEQKQPEEDALNLNRFIFKDELLKKRISSREMKTMSIFRNYAPGEPTFRLYIKNLAKQVDEKDLRYIFGRYIDWSSESEKNMFDVRLMKEGRMKGQAFVTLANIKQAIDAVKETNGFVLHTKPLVVQFARSAKPKEEATKQKSI